MYSYAYVSCEEPPPLCWDMIGMIVGLFKAEARIYAGRRRRLYVIGIVQVDRLRVRETLAISCTIFSYSRMTVILFFMIYSKN